MPRSWSLELTNSKEWQRTETRSYHKTSCLRLRDIFIRVFHFLGVVNLARQTDARGVQPCAWCGGKEDGLYFRGGFPALREGASECFECVRQSLRAIRSCPPGLPSAAEPGERVSSIRHPCHVSQDGGGQRELAEQSTAWTEVNALLLFKSNVLDPLGQLSSWLVPTGSSSSSSSSSSSKSSGTVTRNVACGWRGVGCNAMGHVVNVSLPGTTLTGRIDTFQSLPPEIGNLPFLQSLEISGSANNGVTGLTGVIPPQLSLCRNLTVLRLSNNKLSGQLPAELGQLSNLTELRLGFNQLTGPLPGSIGQLTELFVLELSRNGFYGPLPPSIGSLTKVNLLDLGMNAFSGPLPAELGRLSSLSSLFIYSNQFSGQLPASFANLTSVFYLDASGNSFSGELPVFLPSMSYLYYLDLRHNGFSGPIPPSFTNLTSVSTLLLGSNKLSGPIPGKSLCGLNGPFRYFIDLSNNDFSGPLPPELTTCTSLIHLNVTGNRLSGPIPPSYVNSAWNSTLAVLSLGNNSLRGSIPHGISQLSNLRELRLEDNFFSGPLPRIDCAKTPGLEVYGMANNSLTGGVFISNPAKCTRLSRISLGGNQLQGSLPAESFRQLSVLTSLELPGNKFSGSLPLPLNCTSLLLLDARGNNFSGPLTALQLQNCRSLVTVDLSDNRFEGPLDQTSGEWPSFFNLLSLNLGGNRLSGTIPPVIGQQMSLRWLNLSDNSFQGPISANFGNLSNLQLLDLSRNRLDGGIPPELGGLPLLRTLALNQNQLSGSIPVHIAPPSLPLLLSLNLSSNGFSGQIPGGFGSISANASVDFSYNQLRGPIPHGNLVFLGVGAFAGNPGLCGGPGYPSCPTPLSADAIAGIAVGAFALVFLAGLAAFVLLLFQKSKQAERNAWNSGTMLIFQKLGSGKRLSVDEIIRATDNFAEENKLGEGGFGWVYKAKLEDGSVLAVKRLSVGSAQGDKEVEAELRTLGNVQHRNLVRLVAAYVAHDPFKERLLIYGYMPGGSLDVALAKDIEEDNPMRVWQVRILIALDVARGLKYLHHDCTPRFVHRDVKPPNILLDDTFTAYVTDFGLAREVDPRHTHVSTAIHGTVGYLAPEYSQRGRLTFKSDVFAFGIMLLQLVTGTRPTDERVGTRGIVRWVTSEGLASYVDPRLHDVEDNIGQIEATVKLGLVCCSRVAADRPTMEEVVLLLEKMTGTGPEKFASSLSAKFSDYTPEQAEEDVYLEVEVEVEP